MRTGTGRRDPAGTRGDRLPADLFKKVVGDYPDGEYAAKAKEYLAILE